MLFTILIPSVIAIMALLTPIYCIPRYFTAIRVVACPIKPNAIIKFWPIKDAKNNRFHAKI